MPSNVVQLYQNHAALFAGMRNRTNFEKVWLDRFRALLPSSPHVLDIGCGFGAPVAQYLHDIGCAITGIDTAPALLDIARDTLPAGSWIEADMRTLDLRNRFDGIIAWNSFFHLDHADQRAMFTVFQAHAAKGAVLMFTTGTHHGETIGTFADQPLYHASLDPAEYEMLLSDHGFTLVKHVANDPACNGHSVWLARAAD